MMLWNESFNKNLNKLRSLCILKAINYLLFYVEKQKFFCCLRKRKKVVGPGSGARKQLYDKNLNIAFPHIDSPDTVLYDNTKEILFLIQNGVFPFFETWSCMKTVRI